MFNSKVFILLGALLLVNLTIATTQCKDCIGDSLLELFEEYDQRRHCWFNAGHHNLVKEKIYTLEALIDCFQEVQRVNNELTDDKCKSNVQINACNMKDTDALSECLMGSIKSLVQAYVAQEQCHGEVIVSDVMTITSRLMKGNIAGWHGIHPDC